MDRSGFIFENEISAGAYRRAVKNKAKYIRKYGDDSGRIYHLSERSAPAIGKPLGVKNIVISDKSECSFNEKSVIVGNIRMGFGHYRISMAIASAVHSMGYEPYWFDLHSFDEAVCGKIIADQNRLYSMGSRLSQKIPAFNKLVWEPLNSEGFRRLSYNSSDQKTAELMTPVFSELPKDIPFIAAHTWAAQAALHAGLTNVVNAIPDNWAMALHLAEGAVHTVQTPSVYLGYRTLRGMDGKRILKPMPEDSIVCTGHYIDHELVQGVDEDCARRIERIKSCRPKRWLLSVGGAGAQKEIFVELIKKLIPEIKRGRAALLINVGDHKSVLNELIRELPEMKKYLTLHPDDISRTERFVRGIYDGELSGIHAFCHSDIFAAVYSTNLLMRASDVLITKPSELAFYPVPKLLIKRVGGHEAWGAIRSAEVGDGTYECTSSSEALAMLDLMQNSGDIIVKMCEYIKAAKKAGVYNGAYRVAEIAINGKIK